MAIVSLSIEVDSTGAIKDISTFAGSLEQLKSKAVPATGKIKSGMDELSDATKKTGKAMGFFAPQIDVITERFKRQFSITGLLLNTFRRLQNIIQGLTFGILIGLIVGLSDKIQSLVKDLYLATKATLGLASAQEIGARTLEKLQSKVSAEIILMQSYLGLLNQLTVETKKLEGFDPLKFLTKGLLNLGHELAPEIGLEDELLRTRKEQEKVVKDLTRTTEELFLSTQASTGQYKKAIDTGGAYFAIFIDVLKVTKDVQKAQEAAQATTQRNTLFFNAATEAAKEGVFVLQLYIKEYLKLGGVVEHANTALENTRIAMSKLKDPTFAEGLAAVGKAFFERGKTSFEAFKKALDETKGKRIDLSQLESRSIEINAQLVSQEQMGLIIATNTKEAWESNNAVWSEYNRLLAQGVDTTSAMYQATRNVGDAAKRVADIQRTAGQQIFLAGLPKDKPELKAQAEAIFNTANALRDQIDALDELERKHLITAETAVKAQASIREAAGKTLAVELDMTKTLTESLRDAATEAGGVLSNFFTQLASQTSNVTTQMVSLFAAAFTKIASSADFLAGKIGLGTASLTSFATAGLGFLTTKFTQFLGERFGGGRGLRPEEIKTQQLLDTLKDLPTQLRDAFRDFLASAKTTFNKIFRPEAPGTIATVAFQAVVGNLQGLRGLIELQQLLKNYNASDEQVRRILDLGKQLGITVGILTSRGNQLRPEALNAALEAIIKDLPKAVEAVKKNVDLILGIVNDAFAEIDRLSSARTQFISDFRDRINTVTRFFFTDAELFSALLGDIGQMMRDLAGKSGEEYIKSLEAIADAQIELLNQAVRVNSALREMANRFKSFQQSLAESIMSIQGLGLSPVASVAAQREIINTLKSQFKATTDSEKQLEIGTQLQAAYVKLTELGQNTYSAGTLEFLAIQTEAITGLRDLQEEANIIQKTLEDQMIDLDQLQADTLVSIRDLQEKGVDQFSLLISAQEQIIIGVQHQIDLLIDILNQGLAAEDKIKKLGDQLVDALTIGNTLLAAIVVAEQTLTGTQHGGIVTRPRKVLVGEAGPEAIIPLSRGRSSSVLGSQITVQVENLFARDLNTLLDEINEDNRERQVGRYRLFVQKQNSRITNLNPV